MGTVYRARDLTDGATVAVKILNGRELREAARFDQEASILVRARRTRRSSATSPTASPSRASGSSRWSGWTARTWRRGSSASRSRIAETVALARRAAEALAYAHERGIVHRDVKPENLFLPGLAIERLKVLDFGIARLTRGRAQADRDRVGDRHARLHGARAGARRSRHHAARRRLLARLRAVPVPDRARRVRGRRRDRAARQDPAPGRAARAGDRARACRGRSTPSSRACWPRIPARRLADARAVIAELDALGPLADADGRGHRGAPPRPARADAERAADRLRRHRRSVVDGRAALAGRDRRRCRPSRTKVRAGAQLRRLAALEDDLVRVHGARLHPLPDGSVVLTLPDAGKATDQAARAARCALAMRAVLPDVPLVVSTGPGRFSAWSVAGEVIDNGMRLLRGTAPGAIRLDDVAVGLLDTRFEIRRDGTAPFLRGERDMFEVKRNLLGKATDFVGRGREMSMLTNLYAGTVAESMASAVLVVGRGGRRQVAPAPGVRRVGAAPARSRRGAVRRSAIRWARARRSRRWAARSGAPPAFTRARRSRSSATSWRARRPPRRSRVARARDRRSSARSRTFRSPTSDNDALRAARANPQLMGDAMRRAWEDWLAAECAAHPGAAGARGSALGRPGHGQLRRRGAAQPARPAASWCWRWRAPTSTSSSPICGRRARRR